MTYPLQQRRFRHISASAIRANKKVQLSRTGSRLCTFQPVIDDVRTLPLTPQRVAQTAYLSFKNKFSYISVIAEACDFKFGMQLRFAKARNQIPLEENVNVALW